MTVPLNTLFIIDPLDNDDMPPLIYLSDNESDNESDNDEISPLMLPPLALPIALMPPLMLPPSAAELSDYDDMPPLIYLSDTEPECDELPPFIRQESLLILSSK
jgi:hypothetical protein